MEYANGGTLEDALADADALLPVEDALHVFCGAARGLAHLHEHGVVHRDLKPSNILLHHARDAARPAVLLSDFGECNALYDAAAASAAPRTGNTGTIEFCAPELYRVSPATGLFLAAHSPATDAWSLGMLLYYVLYGGRLPWRAPLEDVAALRAEMAGHAGDISPPAGVRDDVPKALVALMRALLSPDPHRRPSAAAALRVAEAIVPAPTALPALMGRESPRADRNAAPPHRTKVPPVSLIALLAWLGASYACYPHAVSATVSLLLLVLATLPWTSVNFSLLLAVPLAALHLRYSGLVVCACSP
jgi:serine/threonine protein kinase